MELLSSGHVRAQPVSPPLQAARVAVLAFAVSATAGVSLATAQDHTVPPAAPHRAVQAGPDVPPGEAVSGWRTSVVSIRRLQDEFRNSIGDRVFFSAGSDELGSRARAVLAAQAAWMLQRPQVEISIEGHADDAMAGADNEAIAASRARAIRDRLVEAGVEPGRIALTSKGGSDPVATCSDSDCAAQNRRAVIAVGVRRFETGLGPDPFSPARPPAP